MRSRVLWLVAAAALVAVLVPAAAGAEAGPFATPSEVASTLDAVEESSWITVEQVGESVEGRPIQVAVATDPGSPVPREQRVVTFLFTQQHGNEPAGTPAALDVLERIADGEPIRHNLTNQVLVVLPQVNPDGAEAGTRQNVRGTDLNRDHIALEEPETRALHRVVEEWDPDVGLDHHEYGGFGAGNPSPVRAYDYDLTTLYPRHGNVPDPAVAAAKALMYDGIWPEVRDEGYTVNEYGEVTAAGQRVDDVAGGPDPGIQRNHLGLHNMASLLVESRVDFHPNPFHDADRRIDIHRAVMEATVAFAHENAAFLRTAPDEAALAAAEHPDDRYEESEPAGGIFEAYRVPAHSRVPDVAGLHGLEAVPVSDDGVTVPAEGPLRGHAAALVHPDSSRAIVEGRPTYAPDGPAGAPAGDLAPQEAQAAGDDDALPIPGPGALAALAAAGAAAVALERRGR